MSSIWTIIAAAEPTWLDRLFGLSRVSLGDAETVLGWRYALPAWGWALIVLAATALAVWSYSRMLGSARVRGLLAGVRALLLIVVAALLAGPTLVRHDERIESDWLLVLVDRSASMQIRDKLDPATGEPMSRDAQLRWALGEQLEVFDGPESLGAQRHVDWLGFGGDVRSIGSAVELDEWPAADEPRTNIRTAIEQALRRGAGQPISGIVIFTDGQSPQATGSELVHRLQQRAVPVFAVPLGADPMPLNLAVGSVNHPRRAFVDDFVPVTVRVSQLSGEQQVEPGAVRLRLVDVETEAVIDQTTLAEAGAGLDEPVELVGRGRDVGESQWRVEVEYEGDAGAVDADRGRGDEARSVSEESGAEPAIEVEGMEVESPGATTRRPTPVRELVTENNARQFGIEFIDRPIRVLYVEGYPRWEYRYLKNLLIREESIDSSMLLLSADRDFAQEGDTPITRLPATAEEIEPYDVIIVGDVPAGYFTGEQMSVLRDQVAGGGAGFLWIGGERDTPTSYAETPLAALLPMRHAQSVTRFSAAQGRIDMLPTPTAHALRVLTLRSPGQGRDDLNAEVDRLLTAQAGGVAAEDQGAVADWPEHLPPLRWAQWMGSLKAAGEPLAVTRQSGPEGEAAPLIARLRYGAGQSIYIATDETWRWRYGRGDWYYQQFWLQLVRMLGRARVQESDDLAHLSVSQQRVEQGQSVVVELTVRDPALLERELEQVTLDVHRGESPDAAAISLAGPDAVEEDAPRVDSFELREVDASAETAEGLPRKVYGATWQPEEGGVLELRVNEPALAGIDLRRRVEVVASDDEFRRPQPDHERLERLARQTGGAVVPVHELERLRGLVPNRDRRIPVDVSEPLWNSSLALIVILVLLTFEWVLRKAIRLV